MTASTDPAYRAGMEAGGEGTRAADARIPPPHAVDATVAAALIAALVSATVIVALAVFYATEVGRPYPHVWGPISDIGTTCWYLVAAPLFWSVGHAVLGGTRTGRTVAAVTTWSSVLGAASSTLLVVRVLPFGVSTALTVLALLAQCLWLYLVGRAMARTGGWGARLTQVAILAALGQLVGAGIAAASMALDWGSAAQTVVVVGLVPGLLGWASWPLWFVLLALGLRRPAGGVIRDVSVALPVAGAGSNSGRRPNARRTSAWQQNGNT